AIRRPLSVGDELLDNTVGGDVRWFVCRIESELGPDYRIARLRGSFLDVSERGRAQAHIEHLAYHDPPTSLPNRARFRARVEGAIANARQNGGRFAVLFIDLDGFKVINDSLGHDVGDKVLVEIAKRLSEVHRDEDMLSRFGGDEFLVLVDRIEGRRDAAVVARKMLDA